jgi:hypothetical protein
VSVREVGRHTAGVRHIFADEARRKLRIALGPAPFKDAQAHHVVPLELQNHELVDTVIRDFGWNINSSANGIYLHSRPATPGAWNLPLHSSSHDVYTSIVEARLDNLWNHYRGGEFPEHELLQRFESVVAEFHQRLSSGALKHPVTGRLP